MKASELAAKLMETPDLEVFYEEYNCPEFSDGFYWTSGVNGVQITPDGVFITTESLSDAYNNIKTPSNTPVLESISVHIKDGIVPFNIFPLDTDRGDDNGKYFFQELLDHNMCFGYLDGVSYSLSETLKTEEVDYNNVVNCSDVEKVQVLTSYDPVTWEPTYTDYTWEDAKNYFISKYNLEANDYDTYMDDEDEE